MTNSTRQLLYGAFTPSDVVKLVTDDTPHALWEECPFVLLLRRATNTDDEWQFHYYGFHIDLERSVAQSRLVWPRNEEYGAVDGFFSDEDILCFVAKHARGVSPSLTPLMLTVFQKDEKILQLTRSAEFNQKACLSQFQMLLAQVRTKLTVLALRKSRRVNARTARIAWQTMARMADYLSERDWIIARRTSGKFKGCWMTCNCSAQQITELIDASYTKKQSRSGSRLWVEGYDFVISYRPETKVATVSFRTRSVQIAANGTRRVVGRFN